MTKRKMSYAEQKAQAKLVVDRLDSMTGYLKDVYKSMLIEYVHDRFSTFALQWKKENDLQGVDSSAISNYIVMKLAPKTYTFTNKQYANARQVIKQYANNIKKYC